jgi:hypothetical protein
MALKIDTNRSATAFHINDGAVLFPYAVDAQHAIAARQKMHDRNVAEAKARGEPAPAAPLAPPPLSPEDQAALDAHNKTVAESAARLKAYQEKKAKEKAEADQAAQDEAIVASLPPQPDPTARRPLSPAQIRKQSATLTPAEQAAIDKKAADDKLAADKAEHDRLAAASFGGARLST